MTRQTPPNKTSIVVSSGGYLDLNEPRIDQIFILDIARGLSRTNRFNGQTFSPYSVAEHSLLVASLVSKEAQLVALLHDASEAYIGDLSTPAKNLCSDYKRIEENLQDIIEKKYNLKVEAVFYKEEVKEADNLALLIEKEFFFPDEYWAWLDPHLERSNRQKNKTLTCYSQEGAERAFIKKFLALV